MLSVLDLFSDHQLTWTPEAITEALRMLLPTGYRKLNNKACAEAWRSCYRCR